MKKINKIIMLMIIELVLVVGLLSLSTISKLLVAIFFPPVIAVTLFALMISIVDMNRKHQKTVYFIFAIFLVAVALFSTGIGFHYASDEINEAFFPYESSFSLDDILFTKERTYFLDEMFSHWLIIAGAIGIVLGIFFWWYYFKKQALPKIESEHADRMISLFMPVFLGSIIGGLAALGSIEAGLTIYSLLAAVAILPIVLFKLRSVMVEREHITFLFLFGISTIGSYIGMSVAYLLTLRAFPNI